MKTITHLELKPKAIRRNGVVYQGFTDGAYSAEVTPGQSIRIFGTQTNRLLSANFNRIFNIGDRAEYDSYNLRYVGTITAIGPNSVTIKHYEHSLAVTRLDLYSFVNHNWDFDGPTVDAQNAEEARYL